MPTDQNSQSGRRQHFHRRRGPDKRGGGERGGDRRPAHAQPQDPQRSDGVDVDQIMREIRARIAQRHGIDLSSQQIQELAARRLEAILDPRTIRPSLLEQLRKSAGVPAETPRAEPTPAYSFEDDTLFESPNGLVRTMRRWLNPILRLLFNPSPLIQALNTQARLNREVTKREEERDRRQAEWNALHYTVLQRLVVEVSRVSIEAQSLAARVESLGTRVDFNDRRVRGLETAMSQAPAQSSRPVESIPAPTSVRTSPFGAPSATAGSSPGAAGVSLASAGPAFSGASGSPALPRSADGSAGDLGPDGTRRRRRRRRGRRSGPGPAPGEPGSAGTALGPTASGDSDTEDDSPENGGEESTSRGEPSDSAVEPPFAQASAPPSVSDDAPSSLPAVEHEAAPPPFYPAVAPAALSNDDAPAAVPAAVEHLDTDPQES